jgi:prepilin-type N-terminal cleavage/methylation domain-containing protein
MSKDSEFRVHGATLRARAQNGRAAFTLIELLTSIAILLILVGMLTATFNAASTAWRSGEREVERFQQARATLDLLTRDLTQSLVSSNVPFYATSNSLAFVAAVNYDTNSVDLAEVIYRLDTNGPPYKLYRRFTGSGTLSGAGTPINNDKWDFYSNLVGWPTTYDSFDAICDNVIRFSVRCYYTNGNATASYWNSTQTPLVWNEPGVGVLISPAGDGMMTNMPPAFVDVRLAVVDSKTANLMRSLAGSPAALANVTNQATRTFPLFIKIPQR